MTDTYLIFVVNRMATQQIVRLFLAPPEGLARDPRVFANSELILLARPNEPAIFELPIQYVVGAGASNYVFGAGIEVVSSSTENASPGQAFDVDFPPPPPQQQPTIRLSQDSSPPDAITLSANFFNRPPPNNEQGWYSNMSFGLQTKAGFVGMSWSPAEREERVITPEPAVVYLSLRFFLNNMLASFDEIIDPPNAIVVPNSFVNFACTVTLNPDGGWSQSAGAPS